MAATEIKRPKRVGDVLQEQGLITQQQLEQALGAQKQSGGRQLLGEIVIGAGLLQRGPGSRGSG